MVSSSSSPHVMDDDDEFDWAAAVHEIDVACLATTSEKPSISDFGSSIDCRPGVALNPIQAMQKNGKHHVNINSISSSRQSTLDIFIGVSSINEKKLLGKIELSDEVRGNTINDRQTDDRNSGDGAECEDMEVLNGFVKIDPEAAKTWIYPANVPHRDYQFSITRTALFSNTLVVLPTGLGKTLIAAAVMYNFFRWFPEGKIVFAAPSRPLVMQQIEACHNIVGIPQEWTIDLTGQTSPARRAELWKSKRVFFLTPQVFEKDIHPGSCLVRHLVCLVIDEAHRAMGNYAYCVAVRELMDTSVQLRILALTATPGSKQQTIQQIIDNLQISTLEYRNESDPDVIPYVHDRKIELIQVAMGKEAVEINDLFLEVVRPFVNRLGVLGVLQKRDFQTLSPCDLLNSRDKFRQRPPVGLPHTKYGEVEGYFGVLITLYHIRKLLSSHGIRPAYEMLEEKMKQGSFARLMSRNEVLLKAKILMQQSVSHGAPSPKLAKMLEVLIDHFKVKDPQNSRVIIFSNFRGSVRDILDALTNIREVVKATEFIGQSSGKTSKGQSQKVQQAVLQKFRTGGYNVIVATSIGEEGLDIMEVDLVICFDANISPLRMIQRMGRTGRKHEGRVVVLACEGSELKGYKRKQASSNTIKKHLRNNGMNSFNFHSSPRMVPHVFKPEVQFLEMSIEEFVPRGKKVTDDNTISVPAHKTILTDAETDLLAKYFSSTAEISWKPSLIAFPHFQAFPSPVTNVIHSSRTGMLIDTVQYLQGLTIPKDGEPLSVEDEGDHGSKVQVVEPCDKSVKESSIDPMGEKLKTEVLESCVEVEELAEEMHPEDPDKHPSSQHRLLFVSEFVSVDEFGNVRVLSLPKLPLELNSHVESSKMPPLCPMVDDSEDQGNGLKAKEHLHLRSPGVEILSESNLCSPVAQKGEWSGADEMFCSPMSSRMPKEMDIPNKNQNDVYDRTAIQFPVESTTMPPLCHIVDDSDEENGLQAKEYLSLLVRYPEVEVLFESSPRSHVAKKGEWSGADEMLCSPVSRSMPKEMDISNGNQNVVHGTAIPIPDDELSDDLSPRLTTFIKSGLVPESPVNDYGAWNGSQGNFPDSTLISSPNQQTNSIHSWNPEGKVLQDGTPSKMADNNIEIPVPYWKDTAPATCASPVPVAKEMQTPLAKPSNTNSSKEWLFDSGVNPETVEQPCRLKRLRKLRDLNRKVCLDPREQTGRCRKLRTSGRSRCNTTKLGKKQANNAAAFIEEEAEVSSEAAASDDEEDGDGNSSYEDSFIDDGINITTATTQAGTTGPDMMAIYRRSLLSQSPFQMLPNYSQAFSPDSVVQGSRMDGSSSSPGTRQDHSPQAGQESTARNSRLATHEGSASLSETKLESRKRKLRYYQVLSVPAVNLDQKFSQIPEAPCENSHVERSEENNDMFDDDTFYEGIDLDAVEAEAAKLLGCKSVCSSSGKAATAEPVQQDAELLGCPSFDLGI